MSTNVFSNNKNTCRCIYKIIVVGDSGVGKTSLTNRYVYGTFPVEPEATIGVDFREKSIFIENEQLKVILLT
ncbi:hypothetical protein A3Q56_07941 [Intoshia linei]|uniref:Uncharacterized protein n=1 Tax=Intoshia linei TaxID=1819745 RepID=A0A177AS56_9BILA|nr:hypothetical protein A3Q56_07941 [Intoshia linei]